MNDQLSDELLGLLASAMDGLRQRPFYVNLNVGAAWDKYKSIEFLVESLCSYEKHLSDKCTIREPTDLEFNFFKLVLERDAPLFLHENEIFGRLGVKRDRSGLSLPQKNAIAVQAGAQVLWHLKGDQFLTIKEMAGELRDETGSLFEILFPNGVHKLRTVEDWVRPIFPVPLAERKKHWSSERDLSSNIVPIPGIFSESGVNFPKLRFAAICITRILHRLDWRLSQILQSEFIRLLAEPLEEDLQVYVREWVAEAFCSNGSIFA